MQHQVETVKLAALAIALGACMTGTETDVIVTTDAPCTSISNAVVSLSGLQTTLVCNGGSYGIAVYHPDSTQTDVTVVATVDKSDPQSCFGATPSNACIVIHRSAPVAYQTNVNVELDQACAGVFCGANQWCSHAICVSQ
jgi:hypothetical protein